MCGPTYQSRSALWTQEKSVNWYPSPDESRSAQSQIALLPTPGLSLFTSIVGGSPPIQGLWSGDGTLYTVCGNTLYNLNSAGSQTIYGALPGGGATPVQFAASGGSLLMASGDLIFRASADINGNKSVTKVLDGAISVVYLDGYYIALEKDTNTIRLSALNSDGTNWPALDYQTLGPGDRDVRIEEHEGNLWIFGRKTVQVWYDSGDPDNPFQRISGATMNVGVGEFPNTVTKVNGKLFWMGRDAEGSARVYRADGYTPVIVSNTSIEFLLSLALSVGVDQLITGSAYTEDGHTFYSINMPLSGATIVYDVTTNMWHERARWNATSGQWEQWRGAGFHAYAFGKHYVARTGAAPFNDQDVRNIYEQTATLGTDDGRGIRRYRITPYVSTTQQWLFHHYLRLLTDTPANISMRFQKDDGAWSNTVTATPFKNEVHYRRLGRSRNRLYEVSILEGATRPALLEAYLHAEPGVPR